MGEADSGSERTARRVRQLGAELAPRIVELRRHFHAHPELGGREFETAARIEAELDRIGIEHRRIEGPRPADARDERTEFFGTGIVATIRGTAPGAYDADGAPARRVALRSDIDALPIAERTGFEYASVEEGVMHACGHDCHMAMMLGTVEMLNGMRDMLRGEVRIVFQPAEEISSGARDMIAAGALDGVDAIYGAHIWSEVDAGTVSCEPGRRMASTDWFRIDIKGESAHGSMPHKGVDAVVVGAEMISVLQALVSRTTSPFEPVVVTVGEFHGGEARNIMAGSAYLTGTVRTQTQEMREEIADHLERVVGKVAHAFGASIGFDYQAGNPCLVNDDECSAVAQRAVAEVLGDDALAAYEGTLAGEDFAEYLQHVPGVFAFIGTRNPDVGAVHPQHSCYYTVDEDVLANGAMVGAQWAADMLA